MIFQQTYLRLHDNSGVRYIKCIKVLRGMHHYWAKTGDIIVITTKQVRNIRKIRRGEIHKAVILRTKKKLRRPSGLTLKYDFNYGLIINKARLPVCNRIFGPVAYELRALQFTKIVALASRTL